MAAPDLEKIAESVKQSIDPRIKNLEDLTKSFRRAADSHNENVQNVIKDVYNNIFSQKSDISSIDQSVNNLNVSLQGVNKRVDESSFYSRQTMQLQYQLQRDLDILRSELRGFVKEQSSFNKRFYRRYRRDISKQDTFLEKLEKRAITNNLIAPDTRRISLKGKSSLAAAATGAALAAGTVGPHIEGITKDLKESVPRGTPGPDATERAPQGRAPEDDGTPKPSGPQTPSPGAPPGPSSSEQPETPPSRSGGIRVDKNRNINKADLAEYARTQAEKSLKGFVPKWGPNYGVNKGTPEEWSSFIARVIQAESSFRTAQKNPDGSLKKFPSTPSGEASYGPGQFKPGEYGLKSWDDVNNPEKVVEAIISVVKKGKFHAYFGPNTHRRMTGGDLTDRWYQRNIKPELEKRSKEDKEARPEKPGDARPSLPSESAPPPSPSDKQQSKPGADARKPPESPEGPRQTADAVPKDLKEAEEKAKRNVGVGYSIGRTIGEVPTSGGSPGSREFGFRDRKGNIIRQGRGHGGTDLPVDAGQPIKAHLDGKVINVGFDAGGYGHFVDYELSDGSIHRSAHLGTNDGKISPFPKDVKPGYKFKRGDTIGIGGYSGNAGREFPHDHREVWLPKGGKSARELYDKSRGMGSRQNMPYKSDPREYFEGLEKDAVRRAREEFEKNKAKQKQIEQQQLEQPKPQAPAPEEKDKPKKELAPEQPQQRVGELQPSASMVPSAPNVPKPEPKPETTKPAREEVPQEQQQQSTVPLQQIAEQPSRYDNLPYVNDDFYNTNFAEDFSSWPWNPKEKEQVRYSLFS